MMGFQSKPTNSIVENVYFFFEICSLQLELLLNSQLKPIVQEIRNNNDSEVDNY